MGSTTLGVVLDITEVQGLDRFEKSIGQAVRNSGLDKAMGSMKGGGTISSAGQASGALSGAGAAGGKLLAVAAVAAGALVAIKLVLDATKWLMEKGIEASAFAQKSQEAFNKLLIMMLKPIGDVIGGVFYSLIRVMLPYYRVLNMLWQPFMKNMIEGINGVMEGTSDPMARLLGVMSVIQSTISNFQQVLQHGVMMGFALKIVDSVIKGVQLLVVVIGAGFVHLISMLTIGFATLAQVLGQTGAANAISGAGAQLAGMVSTGMVAAIGGLEIVNQMAQLTAEAGLQILFEKILGIQSASVEATATSSNWANTLGYIATAITGNITLGEAITGTLNAIEAAAEGARLTLEASGTTFDTLGEAFDTMVLALRTSLDTYAPEITESWGVMYRSMVATLSQYVLDMIFRWEDFLGLGGGMTGTLQLWAAQIWGGWDGLLKKIGQTSERIVAWIGSQIDNIKSAVATASSLAANPAAVGALVTGVSDAVIAPGGRVISTDPQDYLIATRNPRGLGGGGNFNIVINVSGAQDTKSLVREISRELQYELRGRGSYGYG